MQSIFHCYPLYTILFYSFDFFRHNLLRTIAFLYDFSYNRFKMYYIYKEVPTMDNIIADLYAEFSSDLAHIVKNRLYDGCPNDHIYDCVNEVFLIAMQKQNDASFRNSPKGWLVITARNVVDNFNRKSRLRNSLSVYSYDIQQIPQYSDMTEDYIYKEFLNNDFIKFLNENLSKNEKYLYYLRYSRKMNLKEISNKLQISPNAVNTRLNRLRKKIKEFIRKNIC